MEIKLALLIYHPFILTLMLIKTEILIIEVAAKMLKKFLMTLIMRM